MKLNNILEIISPKTPLVDKEININWLVTDSRTLSFPAESIFFAIRTARNDGHKYITELYFQNLRYFVVDTIRPEFEKLENAVFIQVNDTLDALHKIVIAHRSSFKIPIIGITGSNGKTVVKEWLYQLLQSDFSITRSPKSYNSQIGVPLSVWGLNENSTLGIFEAGISQMNEMNKLQVIINPTIGIFTNLGEAHQENFQSLKQKCDEKIKLFKNSEVLIYCADNKLIEISISQSGFKGKLLTWGNSSKSHLQIINIQKFSNYTELEFKYENTISKIIIPFTDDASIENAINCILTLIFLKYNITDISQRILELESVAMRLEVKEGTHNCIVINDSYNSDLNSLAIALDFLNQQAATKKLSRTIILSDIFQSGQSKEELYQKVADLTRGKDVEKFIGIGSEIGFFASKFDFIENYFFENTESFIKSEQIRSLKNEIVLLKGSRNFHFEDISSKIELVAHETILEVNLNALVENLNYFRSKLRQDTKIMCMVKAFAYGSGAVEVARTLQHHRCDYLAVAVADEGAELRTEGIRIPIVVMNPELGSFNQIFNHNLEPEIYSFRILEAFINAANKLGITDYPVHIKIDSGMHRLGFEMQDMDKLLTILKNQHQLKVRSVFSHLAGADSSEFDIFTKQQVEVFTSCAEMICNTFNHHIMLHILNSAGIERFSEFQFDMVRLGIGHYGISSLPNTQLKQVCALKTIILQIKNVKAGETVGYNRNGKVLDDKRIAVLPIGYADGFDRKLGNGVGEVLINNKRAKVIGNVSMDLITVDITDIKAEEGDVVEIFGEKLLISEVASWLKTISYEVLTSVSRRVKRVYFQE